VGERGQGAQVGLPSPSWVRLWLQTRTERQRFAELLNPVQGDHKLVSPMASGPSVDLASQPLTNPSAVQAWTTAEPRVFRVRPRAYCNGPHSPQLKIAWGCSGYGGRAQRNPIPVEFQPSCYRN
jgi:hypothetical protein